MKRFTRGFTLIELLVVIAIIGILASVVLVSLQSARKKGNDARVQSAVQQLRTQLESDFASNSSYPLTCVAANCSLVTASDGTVAVALGSWGANSANYVTLAKDIYSQSGSTVTVVTVAAAGSNATEYAIYGSLPSNPTTYFCIDSTGKTKANDNQKANVTCSN